MKKYITDEKTGINYILSGDFYIPALSLPEENNFEIGRFGREREQFLKNHRQSRYNQLVLHGKLHEHLHQIDQQAQETYDYLVKRYAAVQGVTEQLKADDQMLWVGRMNNIVSAVLEVIRTEIIFV